MKIWHVWNGFAKVHPYQPAETVQGCLELLFNMTELSEITVWKGCPLQPAAGAHGE
jgi:glycine dehydrogenase subunit 2